MKVAWATLHLCCSNADQGTLATQGDPAKIEKRNTDQGSRFQRRVQAWGRWVGGEERREEEDKVYYHTVPHPHRKEEVCVRV